MSRAARRWRCCAVAFVAISGCSRPPAVAENVPIPSVPTSRSFSAPPVSAPLTSEASCPDPLAPTAANQQDSAYSLVLTDLLADSAMSELAVSASVWVEGLGTVLEVAPDLALFPASNQKLFTAVGSFLLLDPDHRFHTSIEMVEDTLVLRAGGDPTLTAASLDDLARQVSATGVETIAALVVDAGHFETATAPAGRLDWQMPTYTGPLSAFTVDDNRWRRDDEFLSDPATVNGELLGDALIAVGIGGLVVVERRDNHSPTGTVVASLESAPVGDLVAEMLTSSDNETAEALLRELGGGSTSAGLSRIDDELDRYCLGLAGEGGDGSGLSRDNLRSSSEWVRLTRFALSRPWAGEFVAALPLAGRSGTLRHRLTGPTTAGVVHAKTGSIIGGRSLTGVIRADGDRGTTVVFSIVVNGDPDLVAASTPAIDRFVTAIAEVSSDAR